MIFLDTRVVSETLKRMRAPAVLRWLEKRYAQLALSTVVIAELAFGIAKIHTDERAQRVSDWLETWRSRFAGRIFAFTQEAALAHGELVSEAARRRRPMRAPDRMIAVIARALGAAREVECGGILGNGSAVGRSLSRLSTAMYQKRPDSHAWSNKRLGRSSPYLLDRAETKSGLTCEAPE